MFKLIAIVLLVIYAYCSDIANGETKFSFNINWECPASDTIKSVHTEGYFPLNLTCNTIAKKSGPLDYLIKLQNDTVIKSTADIKQLTIVGNKASYAIGTFISGACIGGFWFGIVINDNSDLSQCDSDCGLEKQGTIIANGYLIGGGCGLLNICEGEGNFEYSPPLTI